MLWAVSGPTEARAPGATSPVEESILPLDEARGDRAVFDWDPRDAVARAARGELSPEVISAGSSQLAGLPLVATLLITLGTAGWWALRGPERPSDPTTLGLLLGAAGLSGAWTLVAGSPRLGAARQRDLGHALLFVLALLLGLARHQLPVEVAPFRALPPVALLITAFAAFVPATPRVAFGVCFGAAAMDPLAWVLLGGPSRPGGPSEGVLVVLSTALSAGAAVGVSRVVHRLRQGIARAQEVGSYHLVERLGSGGMADVWRAEHRMLARPAAVKLIRPEVLLRHGPQAAERLVRLFLREANATALLSSPHTILLYDFGVTREGAFYYVMELLRGIDLKRLVERFGPQSSERTAYLLSQMCRSLEEAHARSFVHRDLKPANVFTCKVGEVYDFAKVLDFGLVLDRHPTAEELEDQQNFVGTPAVMAPEMVRFQAEVDARADIYSLGCVAYWLLTGRHVFEADNRADMLVMHAHQKPVPPTKQSGRAVHPGLEALVMSCLEKNPGKRPQSAGELGARLAELTFAEPWTEERARLWWRREQVLPEDAPRRPLDAELRDAEPG
jgi:serine/threonine-protein kinase